MVPREPCEGGGLVTRVRANIVANLVGGAVNALLGIVLVPFYLRYLGIEAYGLVGFFATLLAIFGLFDLGLGLTLTRSMARLSATPGNELQKRDLLRTMELVYWAISLVMGTAIFVLAKVIATRWVDAENLPVATVTNAIRLMGLVGALQFPLALYQAGLLGLQRQVAVNVIRTGSAAVRGAITLIVLAYVAATVDAYFITQAAVTFAQLALTLILLWRTLSSRRAAPAPRFRAAILRKEWRFAATISANTIIGAFLTQSDKVVLAGILPLSEFGYYVLAGTVASALWFAIAPVNTAVYPRLTELIEIGDHNALTSLYHTAAQLVAIAVVPAAATLILFGHDVVLLWTQDAVAAEKTTLPVALLVGGTAVNGLVSVPTYLQVAAGWPQLTMYTNLAGAVALVPAIAYMSTHYGAPGAASVWLLLNLCYLFITIPVMHRRLLRGDKWSWYGRDVLLPVIAASAVGLLFRLQMPSFASQLATAAYIAFAASCMAAATILACHRVRGRAVTFVRTMRRAEAAGP